MPSPISAVSYTPVELYAFDADIFSKLEVRYMPESMKILNEIMNLHNPPGEKLSYYFKEKYKWEYQKDKVLQSIPQVRNLKEKFPK
jgi:hypothetical protein